MTPLLQALEGHSAGVALGNKAGRWAADRRGKRSLKS